jgi:hypothetical protein
MSKVALTERQLIGSFAFFVEAGVTVDAVTVSATAKPDNNPTSNWPEIGCIESAKFSDKKSSETFLCPSEAGGYDEEEVNRVVADFLSLRSSYMNELVKRLEFGLKTKIVLDEAQSPHAAKVREITGWLKIQGRKEDGNDDFVMDWWCKATLTDSLDRNDKTLRPVLRFQKLASALNTVVFPDPA